LEFSEHMSRGRAIALWFTVLAVLLIVAFCGSLFFYAKYKVHRARTLLAEASHVRIGDKEATVLALIGRYGGFKWTPEPLPPREQWIDKEEYDYEIRSVADYKYELEVSPFGTFVYQIDRLAHAMRVAKEVVPLRLQSPLGLRDWSTVVELSVQSGSVQSVSAMTVVRGCCGWVGHRWELANQMPRAHMPQGAYAIGVTHLTTIDGGGEMIDNVITPRASNEESEAARKFNVGCLTSIRACDGLCDIAPRALEYLKHHPDADWNIIPPQCR
jgi:hypothetical protein